MSTMVTIYLPAFLMLAHHRSMVAVSLVLVVVAVGAIGGNVLGGWLGDRFLKPGIFVCGSGSSRGCWAWSSSPLHSRLPRRSGSRRCWRSPMPRSPPAFLAYGSELAPRQRGALFGLIALTNQSGLVIGSAVGAAIIGSGGYGWFAVLALVQGALAAGLALPLLRPRRLG